jgi:hypothetical protein
MTTHLYTFLCCPFCKSGSGTFQINKLALRRLARNSARKGGIQLNSKNHQGVFQFGSNSTGVAPCEHVFHTEVFLTRGLLYADGNLSVKWGAEFRHQHPLIVELDADDVARNYLFENVYLQTGPIGTRPDRPETPHVITGWAEHRWRDECIGGQTSFVELQVHAFLTEDVRSFLVELRQMSRAGIV